MPSKSHRAAYIWRGDLTEGFLRYEFGGLIFGGAYTRRGLFSEFYGMYLSCHKKFSQRQRHHGVFETCFKFVSLAVKINN